MLDHEQHRLRHVRLHEALDELFADYITHHATQTQFTKMPLLQLLTWSKEQAENPTENET